MRPKCLVLLVALSLLAGCATAPNNTTGPGQPATTLTAKDLTDAGVEVVPDESTKVRPAAGHLMLTQFQADVLLDGPGVLGTELDRLSALPKNVVPMSYLLAAWVSKPESDRSKAAARVMGTQDWKHARDVVFPWSVVVLFTLDFVNQLPPVSAAPARVSQEPRFVPAKAPDDCDKVSNFLANAINQVYQALRLTPGSTGSGFFDTIIKAVAVLYNGALDIAKGVVDAVVTTLTKEVFDKIRIAVGALTVASTIAAYLQKESLDVTVEPGNPYRFAIGEEPDQTGQAVARAKNALKNWPKAILDCAPDLPELVSAGAKAKWTVAQNNVDKVITTKALEGTVGSDKAARLDFTTLRESQEQAKGPNAQGGAILTAYIQNAAVDKLLNLGVQLATDLVGSLATILPAAVRDAAKKAITGIVNPVLQELRRSLTKDGGGFSVRGQKTVIVNFHRGPSPKPSAPTPQPGNGGDFCKQYVAMAQWAHDHRPPPTGPWAAGIVQRLTAARPSAPASYAGDVDTMIAIYRLVADGASAPVLANEMQKRDFPGAGTRLATYCKVDPALLQAG